MSRDIKFRAWDKKYNIMINSDSFYNEYISADGKVIEIEEWSDYGGGGYNANDVSEDRILMQYTGLKDKNGKEIYEGDILESNHKLFRFEVIWSEDWAMFMVKGDSVEALIRWATYCEVIGNIYENPELLKEKTE